VGTYSRVARSDRTHRAGWIEQVTASPNGDTFLPNSEHRYRQLFEQSPFSTQVFAPDGRAVAANAAWERLWGVHRQSLDGYNILEDPQLAAKGVMPLIQRAFAGEAVVTPPICYDPAETGKPGRVRQVRAHGYPVKDDAGTILEVVLVLEDISAQQEAEAALRESEERYRLLFEQANDAILVANDEGRYLDANHQAEALTGYSRNELLTMSLADLTPGEVSVRGQAMYQDFVRKGRMAGEYVIRRKDGSLVEVEFSVTRVAPGHYQSILRDVTARKQAERQLALYREIFAHAIDAVAVIDPQGRYLEQNDAHRAMVGYADEELRGCTPAIHLGEATFAAIADALGRTGTYRGDHTSRAKDGSTREIELVAFAVRDEGEQLVCYVGIKRDISDQKRFFHMERQARREAEEAIRLRDEFLGVAAHELKTPMTSLRVLSQLMLRHLAREGAPEPNRVVRTMRAVDEQTAKLSRLVNQLLDIVRLEAGKLSLEREVVDVARLVREVAASVQNTTEQHTIVVDAPSRLQARLDPLRVEQVLMNLLDNAVKYSSNGDISVEVTAQVAAATWNGNGNSQPEGGDAVLLQSTPTRGSGHALGADARHQVVQISIRDHGAGIPPEHRDKIFDRFYRAHTVSHASGIGLGLHICKEIVELHGGRIEAQFPEGGGTRFLVSLPAG
jgi:PAS domain S-box-containing protein